MNFLNCEHFYEHFFDKIPGKNLRQPILRIFECFVHCWILFSNLFFFFFSIFKTLFIFHPLSLSHSHSPSPNIICYAYNEMKTAWHSNRLNRHGPSDSTEIRSKIWISYVNHVKGFECVECAVECIFWGIEKREKANERSSERDREIEREKMQ